MRILSWVQTKINGKQERKKKSRAAPPVGNHAAQDSCKEEFSDWPQDLFTIGTFGRNELKKQSNNHEDFGNSHPLQDLPEFTPEEVNKLEKELIKLLSLKPQKDPGSEAGMRHDSDELFSEFPDCHSSLECNRSICQEFCKELERSGEDNELSANNKIIFNKAKDLLGGKQNNANIGQKSISFLLRKLLLCRSDFAPAPSLRHPVSESKMEKFLKIVLHKKIYPQNSTPTTVKKYLEERQVDKAKIRDKILMMAKDKTKEEPEEGCKWVKTDSEYIVLEI